MSLLGVEFPGEATGYQMIRHILIENFRCFQRLELDRIGRVNVIVGENGSGKTSLLEALFLTLANSPEVGLRFRQQRGLNQLFSGTPRRIEESLWRDLFHNRQWSNEINIALTGDGPEARSLTISKRAAQLSIPFAATEDERTSVPVSFVWKDHAGKDHTVVPVVTTSGMEIKDTGEENPDFFLFPASGSVNAGETASRFSELSMQGRTSRFIKAFTKEYPWITDLSIEVDAGAPVVFATLKGQRDKVPLPNVSGGLNRIVSVMLAIAANQNSVILVDEIENGIYYRHMPAIVRIISSTAKDNRSQIIMSTHSEEWISALVDATKSISDIVLWRTVREGTKHIVRQFSGAEIKAGLEYGVEVR